MTEESVVTEGQCESRINGVYERLNKIDSSVSRMLGGVAVVAFLSAVFVGLATHHMNYRFESIEKTMVRHEEKIDKILENQPCPKTPTTLALQ